MAYQLITPNGDLNYTFDWSDVVGGATISTSVWSTLPTGPTVDNTSIDNTNKTTTGFLSGGTSGQVYQLINRITTSTGTTEEQSIAVRCQSP